MKRFAWALVALFLTASAAQAIVKSPPAGSGGGGAGSVSAVNSPNSTIAVTNSTGPTVSVDVATIAANSFYANATSSTAEAGAINPLAAANLMSAVLSVQAASATGNITLSGPQTIDGQAVAQGQSVLVAAQTTAAQNGIYVVQSGAWTRDINFPSGYVIAQNCDLVVYVKTGTRFGGLHERLLTSSGPVTIGTTAQTWVLVSLPNATTSAGGVVTVTQAITSPTVVVAFISPVAHQFDCPDYDDTTTGTSGTIADDGNANFQTGPCVVSDAAGHPNLNGGTAPVVTGTGCSLVAGGQDNRGAITATGVDTCTLTFGATFTAAAPVCSIGNVGATVLAYLNALPSAAAAVFKTTAAGTFTYTCF